MRTPLTPIIVELTPSEKLLLTEEIKETLRTLGINLEFFGGTSFQITEIPIFEEGYDENIYVNDVIQQVLHNDKLDIQELRKNAIATMACKVSVKANKRLTYEDMKHIIFRLSKQIILIIALTVGLQ